MSFIIQNGKLISDNQLSQNPTGAYFQFGYGIFESIRCENGGVYYFSEHIKRLSRSARELKMPLDKSLFSRELVEKLLKKNSLASSLAKIKFIFSGEGDHWIMAAPARAVPDKINLKTFSRPMESPFFKYKMCNYFHTWHILKGIKGAYDYVRVNGKGNPVETGMANLGAHKNGILYLVDEKENILPGVTQGLLKKHYRRWFKKIVFTAGFMPSFFKNGASGLYLNSLAGAKEISRIDSWKLPLTGVDKEINQFIFSRGVS